MSFDIFLQHFYELTMVAAGIITAFRYRKLDKRGRYLAYWVWLGTLTEGLGYVSIALIHTNLQVYGFASFMEFFLFWGYFNECIPRLKKKNSGITIGMVGVLLGILNSLFLQPLKTVNFNFLFLGNLSFICLALYMLYRMFAKPDLNLLKESHFWFACTIVFYGCIALWNWTLTTDIWQYYTQKATLMANMFVIGNVITYGACGILFYRYPKMRQTYV